MNNTLFFRNRPHRIVLGGLMSTLVWLIFSMSMKAQTPGSLDANFDADGLVTVPFSTGDAAGYSLILNSSTDILLAGWVEGTTDKLAVAKMSPDGSPASSFDGDGKILSDYGDTHGRAYAMARYAGDDFIVVGESRSSGGDMDFGIARYTEDGQLVAGFGNGGFVTTDFVGNSDDRAWSVAVQSDGRILVGGWTTGTDGYTDIAVSRYLSNGTLDVSFSFDGKVIFDPSQSGFGQVARKVLVQPDGKILIVGEGLPTVGQNRPVVLRLEQDGELDQTFNGSGFGYYPVASPALECWDATLLPDGRIVLVGRTEAVDPFLCTVNPDGTLDAVANLSGPYGLVSMFYGVATQDDGRIICVGYSSNNGTTADMMIACFHGNLDPDTNFSSDGYVFTSFETTGLDVARDVLVQPNGRILVGGYATSTSGQYFALARFFPHFTVGLLELGLHHRSSLNIYPNPIVESATLTYALAETEELTIALHDMHGRVLATYLNGKDMPAGEHTQTITMPSDLASGNYLLLFSSPKGKMSVQVSK